jgi:hypothetical protein
MDPMIVACLTGVAVILSATAIVVRNRRARNSK